MNREQFFAECASSYPKALLAIAHLRDYVREECQATLRKRIEDICHSVGLPHEQFEIVGWAQPDQLTSANPNQLFVGAKGKRSNGKEQVWAYVYWERDSKEAPFRYGVGFDIWPVSQASHDKFASAVDIAVEKPSFADELWGWDREGEVSFYSELEVNRLAEFASELDCLITKVPEVVGSIENVARFFRN